MTITEKTDTRAQRKNNNFMAVSLNPDAEEPFVLSAVSFKATELLLAIYLIPICNFAYVDASDLLACEVVNLIFVIYDSCNAVHSNLRCGKALVDFLLLKLTRGHSNVTGSLNCACDSRT